MHWRYDILCVPVATSTRQGPRGRVKTTVQSGTMCSPRDGFRDYGRGADVLVMPDGALLVSDDRQGAIYRISYGEK